MITGAEQWTYVLAAYGAVAIVLVALIAWVVLDGRRRAVELAGLEARGARRRATPDSKPEQVS